MTEVQTLLPVLILFLVLSGVDVLHRSRLAAARTATLALAFPHVL